MGSASLSFWATGGYQVDIRCISGAYQVHIRWISATSNKVPFSSWCCQRNLGFRAERQLWGAPPFPRCFKIEHCWHCFTFHDKTNLISLLKCFNLPLSTSGAQWLHWDFTNSGLRETMSLCRPSFSRYQLLEMAPVFFVVSLLFPVKSFHWWPQVLNLTVLSRTEPTTFYEMNFLKSGPVLNQWVVQFCPPATGFGVLQFLCSQREHATKFKNMLYFN